MFPGRETTYIEKRELEKPGRFAERNYKELDLSQSSQARTKYARNKGEETYQKPRLKGYD